MRPSRLVEAVLFASEAPLSAAEIARVDEALDEEDVERLISELNGEYERESRAVAIFQLGGGYQMLTRPEYDPALDRMASVPVPPRLSTPALETLAIVAYRQPVSRAEIEEIRGVAAGGVLRTLQERGLVEIAGRGEGLGRPLLYGTTRQFLQHFGFRSLHDLPRPTDLPVVLSRLDADER